MKTSRLLVAALATLVIGASPQLASADSIPGLRGHDHTGITVPDIKAATAFFTDVIGCSPTNRERELGLDRRETG